MKEDNRPSKETLDQWHNDPANWLLGIFYFNKSDKRLLLPKRLSFLGWTINFANPIAIFLLILLIFIIFMVFNNN